MALVSELVVSPKSHHSDTVNLQCAEIIGDYAGQFRPSYGMFFVPGSERTWKFNNYEGPENPKRNLDRTSMEILEIDSESHHTVVPMTAIFEQGIFATKE